VILMNMAAPAIDYVTRPRIVGHETDRQPGRQ
jgi:Na+-translocating ferredoxin:NAD+ oxidoreductase RnfD subunit